jgi:hypothetical protein
VALLAEVFLRDFELDGDVGLGYVGEERGGGFADLEVDWLFLLEKVC